MYVSSKYSFILSWLALLLSLLISCATLLYVGHAFFYLHKIKSLLLGLIVALFVVYLFVPTIKLRTILIINNKILLKGIFGSREYLLSDFKNVEIDWRFSQYMMQFKDGKSFPFFPKQSHINILIYSMLLKKDLYSISDEIIKLIDRVKAEEKGIKDS